ncbi:MAG: DUF2807 domain-containing protein [Bacteroidetes bacterium]|nr:DUF2807 domain-containing protein [Bacteroidota bacterium]
MKNILATCCLFAIMLMAACFPPITDPCPPANDQLADTSLFLDEWVKENGTFKLLNIRPDFQLDYMVSDNYGLEISAGNNVLSKFGFRQESDSLYIDYAKCIRGRATVTGSLTAPEIKYFQLAGNSAIKIENQPLNQVFLTVNELAWFNVNTPLNRCEIDFNSTDSAYLKDSISNLVINHSGEGVIDGQLCNGQYATIDVDSTGSVYLGEFEKLNVTIAGRGNVYYKGEPEIKETITGKGQLIKLP